MGIGLAEIRIANRVAVFKFGSGPGTHDPTVLNNVGPIGNFEGTVDHLFHEQDRGAIADQPFENVEYLVHDHGPRTRRLRHRNQPDQRGHVPDARDLRAAIDRERHAAHVERRRHHHRRAAIGRHARGLSREPARRVTHHQADAHRRLGLWW